MITAEHMAAAAKHGRRDKGDEHSIHHRRASARAKRLEYDPSYSSARCRFETAPRQCAPQWRCGAHCPSAGRSGWTAASAPGSDRVSETNRQNFSDLEHLGLELLHLSHSLCHSGQCSELRVGSRGIPTAPCMWRRESRLHVADPIGHRIFHLSERDLLGT